MYTYAYDQMCVYYPESRITKQIQWIVDSSTES